MLIIKNFWIPITLLFFITIAAPLLADSYYVDCRNGSDDLTGKIPAEAWKSLERVNETSFSAGDQILLKRGETCEGMLWPKGSGEENRPMKLSAYGEGALPIIQGGDHEAAIKIFNQQYWEIENIEAIGGTPYGVLISGDRSGILKHFRIRNVVVHDVGGEVETKDSGLIVVFAQSAAQVLEDIVIDGVTAYGTTQWSGIIVDGGSNEARARDVAIRNSIVYDVYGDGIILYEVENGVIEKSAAWHVGLQPTKDVGTPNGIWTWRCRNCVVQYTEGFSIDSPGVDGGVYDIDWGNEDNIVQYNYGHDAMGYCIAVFGSNVTTSNSIVRYNVCVNNGRSPKLAKRQGDLYLSTWNGGDLDGLKIYNNTFYWNPPIDAPALIANDVEFSGSGENLLANNLFYSTVPTLIDSDSRLKQEGNLFWYSGLEEPRWLIDGESFTGCEEFRRGMGEGQQILCSQNPDLTAFMRLAEDSPAIDAGMPLVESGQEDAFGKSIPIGPKVDIGAVEWRPNSELSWGEITEGGVLRLENFEGKWTLVSFLAEDSTDSRSQVIFLQSARQQFSDLGLQVVAAFPGGLETTQNLIFDWDLQEIETIPFPGNVTVETWPTTALISPSGKIMHWWEGFVTPSALGLTLRALVGEPVGALPINLPLSR